MALVTTCCISLLCKLLSLPHNIAILFHKNYVKTNVFEVKLTLQRSYYLFFILVFGIGAVLIGSVVTQAQGTHNNDHDQADSDTVLAEHGYEIFVANGCTACHGQNAEGNDIGPALAGHSEFAIRRQVRTPTNIMLAFSPIQIPAEDLDALVAYIVDLEVDPDGENGHDEHNMSDITTGDMVFAHHWFLWLELEMEDVDGSIHHTAHILELLTDGPHKAMMQPVLTALVAGDVDTARSIVEPMVTDVGEFSDDIYTVGMQLTYQAITSGDQEAAIHFATDLSEHDLTDDQLESVTGALELIEACEIDEAVTVIESMLGDNVYFIPNAMDMSEDEMEMDMGDDHSDDTDHDDEMDMDTDHNETSASCGEQDEDVESTTEDHGH